MKLELNSDEVDKLKVLVVNRISDLRNIVGEAPDNEEELKEVIRGYKRLLGKLNVNKN